MIDGPPSFLCDFPITTGVTDDSLFLVTVNTGRVEVLVEMEMVMVVVMVVERMEVEIVVW